MSSLIVARLWRRVTDGGDPAGLLSGAAASEIEALAGLAAGPDDDPVAVGARCALAVVRRCRHALDPAGHPDDARLADALALRVAPLRRYCGIGPDPDRWAADAVAAVALTRQVDAIRSRLARPDGGWTSDELDRAVAVLIEAVDGLPPFRGDHLLAAAALSEAVSVRFDRDRGRVADADTAVDAAALVLAAQEPRSGESADALLALGLAVVARSRGTARDDGLADVRSRVERAIAEAGEPQAVERLQGLLPLVIGTQLELTGDEPELLDRAIRAAHTAGAVASTPTGRVDAAGNLAALLTRRAVVGPTDASLDAAVSAGRAVVDATARSTDGHATRWRAGALGNLSWALRARFELRAERLDLLEAIRLGEESVRLLPPGDADRPGRALNLLAAMARLAEAEPTPEHVDAAVRAARQAVDEVPDTHPIGYKLQLALGGVLGVRFNALGDPADLRAAHDAHRVAAAAPGVGDPGARAVLRSQVCRTATTLGHAALLDGDPAAARRLLAEAVAAGELGRAGLDESDPRWAVGTYHLAVAHVFAAAAAAEDGVDGDGVDAGAALQLLSDLWRNEAVAVTTRLDAHRPRRRLEAVLRSPVPLHVAVTLVDELRADTPGEFASRADLRSALRAGTWLPLATRGSAEFRGRRAIDGGALVSHPSRFAIESGCSHLLSLSSRGRRSSRPDLLQWYAGRHLERMRPGLGAAFRRADRLGEADRAQLAVWRLAPGDSPAVLDVFPRPDAEISRQEIRSGALQAAARAAYETMWWAVSGDRVRAYPRLVAGPRPDRCGSEPSAG